MRKLDPWGTRPALGVGGNEARGNKEKGKKKAPKLSNSVCVPPLPLLLDFLRHCSSGARRGKSEYERRRKETLMVRARKLTFPFEPLGGRRRRREKECRETGKSEIDRT